MPLEEKKDSYLNSRATNVLFDVVSNAVIYAIIPFYNAHEFWTMIQEKYDVSNIIEDGCIPSTSGRNELSSTLPMCGKTQGNDMVSGDEYCNVDSELTFDDCSSLSHCNTSSLDLNTSSTTNALHACVDSPCISCACCLNTSHDDMLVTTSCHDINASSSSSCCVSNNVEETCGDPAYHCMCSMQVVDITPMKYHLTSITSIRVVQQKHHRSKVCL
jgi:hypothetical protein